MVCLFVCVLEERSFTSIWERLSLSLSCQRTANCKTILQAYHSSFFVLQWTATYLRENYHNSVGLLQVMIFCSRAPWRFLSRRYGLVLWPWSWLGCRGHTILGRVIVCSVVICTLIWTLLLLCRARSCYRGSKLAGAAPIITIVVVDVYLFFGFFSFMLIILFVLLSYWILNGYWRIVAAEWARPRIANFHSFEWCLERIHIIKSANSSLVTWICWFLFFTWRDLR